VKITILTIIMFLSFGACTTPTTENPTNPEADDPIIEGEEVVAPIGCLVWQINDPNADC